LKSPEHNKANENSFEIESSSLGDIEDDAPKKVSKKEVEKKEEAKKEEVKDDKKAPAPQPDESKSKSSNSGFEIETSSLSDPIEDVE
jgi:hypothetical protein